MTRAALLAPHRYSLAEICQLSRLRAREVQRTVSGWRLSEASLPQELTTAEAAYLLCRSRYFVGDEIRSGRLRAKRVLCGERGGKEQYCYLVSIGNLLFLAERLGIVIPEAARAEIEARRGA